jgi:hypothetical protein
MILGLFVFAVLSFTGFYMSVSWLMSAVRG